MVPDFCLFTHRLKASTNPESEIFDKVLEFQIKLTSLLFKHLVFFVEFVVDCLFIERSRFCEEIEVCETTINTLDNELPGIGSFRGFIRRQRRENIVKRKIRVNGLRLREVRAVHRCQMMMDYGQR